MAFGPSGPWAVAVEEGPDGKPVPVAPTAPGPYDGTALREIAVVYRACARVFGWTAEVVDEMELWQIAAAFDTDLDPPGLSDDAPNDGSPPVPSGGEKRDLSLVAARVAHARGEGPAPEAQPASAGTVGLMNRFRSGGGAA